MRLHTIRYFMFACLLASCANIPASPSPSAAQPAATQTALPLPTQTLPLPPVSPPTQRPISTPTIDPLPTETSLDPAQWMTWPVTPIVTAHVREIYELGQTLGNDPYGFSILGDCQ